MSKLYTAIGIDGKSCNFQAERPNKCPLCNGSGEHKFVEGGFIERESWNFSIDAEVRLVFKCTNTKCMNFFIAYYTAVYKGDYSGYNIGENKILKPMHFYGKNWGTDVVNMLNDIYNTVKGLTDRTSETFLSIYNEAENAESLGMLSICGGGYRKALEFLIKDYVIYCNPNDKDIITGPKFELGKCIDTYLQRSSLAGTFATMSAWLGNDSLHYVIRHPDMTIPNLKKYIGFTIQAIGLDYEQSKINPKINPNSQLAQ